MDKNDKLLTLTRALKAEAESADGLPLTITKRISRIAALNHKEKAPRPVFLTSRTAVAAAMVSAVILLLFSLPLFVQFIEKKGAISEIAEVKKVDESMPGGRAETVKPLQISTRKVDNSIILSWEDSKKGPYKVSRSTSPKDFSNAYTVLVAENHWTDTLMNGSKIVYYKIE